MKEKIMQRIKSDRGAIGTTEAIILIVLAVFASLAIFTFILAPSRDSAETVGNEIQKLEGSAIDAMTGDYQ